MVRFADERIIEVRSGKGGNGCIAFRREKYVPMGGPVGGDGGRGGDVVFCVKHNLRTLSHMRHRQVFKARNGGDGEGGNRFGRNGEDVLIPVPPGTVIRDANTGALIHDFAADGGESRFVFLSGGKGGWGNARFKTSTNQAPRFAHEGSAGESRLLKIELNIIADMGLVGFPNAGKSSLLDAFTNARPKVAPYPFTTKIPNLGALRVSDERDIIIADIPGIIEGASDGAGLGIRFLKHISRTAGLVFIIDCSDESCLQAYDILCRELEAFSPELAAKPRIVLCNKIDIEGAEGLALAVKDRLRAVCPDLPVLPLSIHDGRGLNRVRRAVIDLADRMDRDSGEKKRAERASSFLATRSACDDMPVQYPGSGG